MPLTREEFERLEEYHEKMAREIGHSDDNTKSCRDLGVRMWLYLAPAEGYA